MKPLPEILRDAMLLLDNGQEDVVIARGHTHEQLDGRSSVFQIRLQASPSFGVPNYRCQSRSWLGEQWSPWRVHHGWLGGASFDLADVIAIDWRIASCQP
jgi:hypothetical protein